jgi:hypothetical protein
VKSLCKRCPQLALCLTRPNSRALDLYSSYPQRREFWNQSELVFVCWAPRPTGETQVANAGLRIDVFRIDRRGVVV